MIFRRSCPVLALLFQLTHLHAQEQQKTPPYTIQANTRVVLTDVTVTDTHGLPVHGLPQAAFHIFDDNQPQTITSFEEHAGVSAVTMPESTSGSYSNDYLLHLPPVLNIIVIDIANLEIPERMYLNYQLTKFLNELPEEQPLAVYLRAGSGCFLVQNFTSDKKLLLDAVHKAIPRFPPTGREYLSDFDTLHKIALSLAQIPGRKNVLWFSGGSTLYLQSDIREDTVPLRDEAAWRTLYDELDEERIAVYPIDVRGLMVEGVATAADQQPANKTTPGQSQFMSGSPSFGQRAAMEETARATGGHAFYNNNDLKDIAEHVLSTGSSFYTLTYSPHDLRFDNKWHKVRVAISGGPYHLSYRTGYFADGSLHSTDGPVRTRTRLLANGEKLEVPELSGSPIIFRANVVPASDPAIANWPKASTTLAAPHHKKGAVPFIIRYVVPVSALTIKNVNDEYLISLGIAVLRSTAMAL
jgi:VWFA-related protein